MLFPWRPCKTDIRHIKSVVRGMSFIHIVLSADVVQTGTYTSDRTTVQRALTHIFTCIECVSAVKHKKAMRYLNTKWVYVLTFQQCVFTFEQLALQQFPLSQSLMLFNQNVNTSGNLSSSEILNFTCYFIKCFPRKKPSLTWNTLNLTKLSGQK